MKRDPFPWILAGTGLIVFGVIGGALVYTRIKIAGLYDDIFPRYGLHPSWGKAIGLWEGRGSFKPDAIGRGAGDAKRGYAWGVNQITLQTAQEHGFKGEGKDLLDPLINVEWMARILSSPIDKHGVRREKPKSLKEAASMWNSGTYPGDGDTPSVTLSEYIPGVERYA